MPAVKIAFIGGGSAQWAPKITTDLVLTTELSGSHLVLYDIDPEALELTCPLAQRIAQQAGTGWHISATTDRSVALDGADYVILSIRVGGVEAMWADLEIPLRYGIHQTVGDTVGPGGLSRALRHIPVAVEIARDMEQRCPGAWLINLTNPMSTICRAVTKVTSVPTIGLCHEVINTVHWLASLFGVKAEDIHIQVAGINHFAWILKMQVGGKDGFTLLRDYLAEHSPFEHIAQIDERDWRSSFEDYGVIKFLLFQRYGTFPAAGDRHIIEFFPWFLTEATGWGRRYGVLPTTYEFRLQELEHRRRKARQMLAQEGPLTLSRSREQVAGVIAALATGKPARFVVNFPNRGQITNLPLDAIVEGFAYVGDKGVEPICVGFLPLIVQELIIGHVLRQEMIVEAALYGDRELALQALSGDPLVLDWEHTPQMLNEMLNANREYLIPSRRR
ncbi:MAG: hypothetical protein DRI61_05020 [Chloroflexi bacterium]|nr:MAG: hypothetical protein DRI61_05020 [Chloroflexota bacterium]